MLRWVTGGIESLAWQKTQLTRQRGVTPAGGGLTLGVAGVGVEGGCVLGVDLAGADKGEAERGVAGWR